MKKRVSPPKAEGARSGSSGGFVLGRDRFALISAVEGIALTGDMHRFRDQMDHQNLSAAERRSAIIRRHTPTR